MILSALCMRIRGAYSVHGISQCIDFVACNIYRYQLTGEPDEPVYMTNWNIWTDDNFVQALSGALDSPATAELICDTIVNFCANNSVAEMSYTYEKTTTTQTVT